jgi:hypothetical protein
MVSFGISMAVGAVVLALLCWYAVAGFRAGDRSGDARVTAVLREAGQPDERRPVVVVTVRNPSGTPVLAGLSVRRACVPQWLGGLTVTVPRRTSRRAYRPTAFPTIGIVPGGTAVRFMVPVHKAARAYQLTAAVGQAGGRLRVYRLHVAGGTRFPSRAERPFPLARVFRIIPNVPG